MATYSGGEAIVNVFTTTANYTVPTGRYAKITVQKMTLGNSSSVLIGSTFWSVGGSAGGTFYPQVGSADLALVASAPEFIITSGETATLTGPATFVLTVREFNNP